MMTLNDAAWWTSSYTNEGATCVEVADLDAEWAVRDTKDRTGPALVISRAQWGTFLAGVHADHFQLI
jgi:hypothetical protein